jgi:hypothetical protein
MSLVELITNRDGRIDSTLVIQVGAALITLGMLSLHAVGPLIGLGADALPSVDSIWVGATLSGSMNGMYIFKRRDMKRPEQAPELSRPSMRLKMTRPNMEEEEEDYP